MAAGGRSIKGCFDVALDWHVWVQTGGRRRRRRPAAPRLPETGELCLEGAARRRRAHDRGDTAPRRQRSCLSGRCPGHRPGSGGPKGGGGEVRAARPPFTRRWRLPYQEGPEHGDGGEEVPDIVVVEEGEQDAVPVVLAGLRRGFLSPRGEISTLATHSCAKVAWAVPTCQVLRPWKKK